MTNPETLLKLAAEAITLRAMPGPAVYAICCIEGNLLCIRRMCVVDQKTIIATYANATLEAGLNGTQWNELRLNLTAFFKDSKSCPTVLKP